MKVLDCLPLWVVGVVREKYSSVEELRVRAGRAARIKVAGSWYYINGGTLSKSSSGAEICTDQTVKNIITAVCDNSIYAYERQLMEGFLTTDDGCRIGVAGSVSAEGDVVKCFTNYTSLCIRFPHFHDGHAKTIASHLTDTPQSVLIIGLPASGKTTTLRSLCCILSDKHNVVLVDERGEVSSCDGFSERAINVDVIKFCPKAFGLNTALRTLSPDYLACDELTFSEIDIIKQCQSSGLAVIATIHGKNLDIVRKLNTHGVFFDFYCILHQNHRELPQLFSESLKSEVL
jgi:stage III sporulation protein AA